MTRKDIIQELSDLQSTLGEFSPRNVYAVPVGYFDGLAEKILQIVRDEELSALNLLPRIIPYSVPAGYFDGLEERIMNAIRNHPDYRTSSEELEAISPLLNSLSKRP